MNLYSFFATHDSSDIAAINCECSPGNRKVQKIGVTFELLQSDIVTVTS